MVTEQMGKPHLTNIRWFKDVRESHSTSMRLARPSEEMIDQARGNGANLAEINRTGIQVPNGFVITTEA
jgi:hypothetical protein|tara:strand:- start:32 stop:238 length:207 start_codon:yes stop_codon:yes gene_type:complete